MLENLPGSSFRADAASLAAGRVFAPLGNLAAYGTVTHGTLGDLGGKATFLAAELSLGKKSAGALTGADTTTFGAGTERTPSSNFAINRALLSVATRVLEQLRAFFATEFGENSDGAGALVSSHTTGKSAGGKGTPFSDLAVGGTGSLVAFFRLLEGGTRHTTVGSILGYNTGMGHLAAAASCRAGGPEAPVSSETVHWAFFSSTFGPLLKHGAVLAAVYRLGQDLTVTHLATRATALGALAKLAPIGHFAVGRAGLGLAHLLLLHGTTRLPIVNRLHRQDTVTVLNTLTTTLRALGV